MQLEPTVPPSPRRRRMPSERLERAVLSLAGAHVELIERRETAWASITFAGTRQTMALAFAGETAVADGEAFIAALPDHEFAIPRLLVADATVLRADHALLPAPRLTVEVELLVLDEV